MPRALGSSAPRYRSCLHGAWLCLLLAMPAHAEIYRYVDEHGNLVFTDEPKPGATRIELPPPTIYSAPATTSPQDPGASAPPAASSPRANSVPAAPSPSANMRYERLAIVSPVHDSAFHSGDGNVQVSVEVAPPLAPRHQLEILLDGQPAGRNRTGQFTLPNVDRGTHQLTTRIISIDGQVVHEGDSGSTFTVHRPIVRKPSTP